MSKKDFMTKLNDRLSGVDTQEKKNIINYYDELIDDKIESGIPENEAIADLGTIDEIAIRLNIREEVKIETKTKKITMSRDQKKILIIILICTFPLWVGIIGGVFGFIVAVIATVFGIFITGISLVIGGVIGTFMSIFGFGSLLSLGCSFVMIGVGLLLIPPTIKFGQWCYENGLKGIRYLGKKVKEL